MIFSSARSSRARRVRRKRTNDCSLLGLYIYLVGLIIQLSNMRSSELQICKVIINIDSVRLEADL